MPKEQPVRTTVASEKIDGVDAFLANLGEINTQALYERTQLLALTSKCCVEKSLE